MPDYTITVTDEVDAAIKKVAAKDRITAQEVIEKQLLYYVGCALYDFMELTVPLNTPELGPADRAEAYGIAINQGDAAARTFIDTKVLEKRGY